MSSQRIDLIAILSPRAGKVDRLSTLLTTLGAFVEANEPDTLRYQLHREVNKKTGVEELIMIESYKDEKALAAHGSSKEFKEFYGVIKKEDLVERPTQLKFVREVSGFGFREGSVKGKL